MLLGTWRSPHLTAAVLDQFLGDQPLDPAAKARAGAGLLFLTNGFRCDLAMASVRSCSRRLRCSFQSWMP